MTDPEVQVFRNLRQMNFAQLEHFDPEDPRKITADADPTEGNLMADELAGGRYKPRSSKHYHYNIGKYEESTYYCQFLSNKLICLPSGRSATVRKMTTVAVLIW